MYPTEITRDVERVLNLIKSEFEPEIVTVKVESYSQPLMCFINVAEKVRIDGGKVHYGWAILQSSFLMEAERHAVWEDDEGNLIDITPREIEIESIMFVSDNNFEETEKLTDNLRVNIMGDIIVDDYIKLNQVLTKLRNLGRRNRESKTVFLGKHSEYLKFLGTVWLTYENHIKEGGRLNNECWCKKGITYKNCCRKSVLKYVDTIHRNILQEQQ